MCSYNAYFYERNKKTMSSVILPKEEPFTTTFTINASIVSVLLSDDRMHKWLLNNFIQINTFHNRYFDYYDFNFRNCPYIDYQRIRKALLPDKEIISFIINAIENGLYICLVVNTKYIQAWNRTFDMAHELFIYGCDTEKKIFYISSNFKYGKYSNSTCSFLELENSIAMNAQENDYWDKWLKNNLVLISFDKSEKPKFYIDRVKNSIQDYLSGTQIKNWYVNQFLWSKEEIDNRAFGIDCYKALHGYIDRAVDNHDLDFGWRQSFHFMWEHKKIMLTRIKYMIDNEYLENFDIADEYEYVVNHAQMSLSLLLKYSICKDEKLLNRAEDMCRKVKAQEMDILQRLLHEL